MTGNFPMHCPYLRVVQHPVYHGLGRLGRRVGVADGGHHRPGKEQKEMYVPSSPKEKGVIICQKLRSSGSSGLVFLAFFYGKNIFATKLPSPRGGGGGGGGFGEKIYPPPAYAKPN